MSFARMMEKNLEDNGYGMPEKVSEVDTLVFADDQILMDRYAEKDARAIRIANHNNRKNRRKALYEMRGVVSNYVHRTYLDRDDTVSIVPIFRNADSDTPTTFVKKGRRYEWEHLQQKAKNKKVRRECFEEPIADLPRVCGVTLAEDEDEIHAWLMAVHHEADWWSHHENTIGFTTDLNEIWDKEVETRYNELHHLKMRVRAEICKLEREIESAKEKISQYSKDIKCINDQIADLLYV